ncbi:hypothetical protein P3T23_009695 [Paraburkholderia sp. GAS448]
MPRSLSTPLSNRLGISLPIVQGPMNGGSTPEMVAAVSNAGGLGSLAAVGLSADAMRTQVAAIRLQSTRSFNINLFVLDTPAPTGRQLARAIELLQPVRAELGLAPGKPLDRYCEGFRHQLDTLIELRVSVASFTFGLLDAQSVERLHQAGSLVVGTATNVAEALAWEANGADIICAQGAEAGGHRGTFLGHADDSMSRNRQRLYAPHGAAREARAGLSGSKRVDDGNQKSRRRGQSPRLHVALGGSGSRHGPAAPRRRSRCRACPAACGRNARRTRLMHLIGSTPQGLGWP